MLVWDATCPDTFALSHLQLAATEAGAVADQAEQRKRVQYTELPTGHHFNPVAIETTGVFHDLGCRIREDSGEPQSYYYLVQGRNTAAVMGTSFPRTFDPHFDNV